MKVNEEIPTVPNSISSQKKNLWNNPEAYISFN
jgi:hypothetical protein